MSEQQHRNDWDRHREQVRRGNAARFRAYDALIAEHQDEWDRMFRLWAAVYGVTPRGMEPMTESELALEIEWEIERLKARLLAEGYELDG